MAVRCCAARGAERARPALGAVRGARARPVRPAQPARATAGGGVGDTTSEGDGEDAEIGMGSEPVAPRAQGAAAAADAGADDVAAEPAAEAEEQDEPANASANGSAGAFKYTPPPLPSASDAMDAMDVDDLKEILLDTMEGTERGLSGSAESRGEILELIARLEAINPTPAPTASTSMAQLEGKWRLVWTSTSELVALLAASRLPLVRVVDIFQTIDGASRTAENNVVLELPFARTSVSATAEIEVTSPKRLNVTFTKTGVATPTLLDDIDVPSSVEVMGTSVDLGFAREPLLALKVRYWGALARSAAMESGMRHTRADNAACIPCTTPAVRAIARHRRMPPSALRAPPRASSPLMAWRCPCARARPRLADRRGS